MSVKWFLLLYTRETTSFLSTCKNSIVNSFTHPLWLKLIMFFQLPWNLMLKLEKNMLKIHLPRGRDFTLQTPRREPCLLFSKKPRNLHEKCRTLLQKNWDLKGALLQIFLWMPEDGIQSSESQGTCICLNEISIVVNHVNVKPAFQRRNEF